MVHLVSLHLLGPAGLTYGSCQLLPVLVVATCRLSAIRMSKSDLGESLSCFC
ncbi:hypothetical protein PF005_g30130 [Phytophthora fragariae]|uniref:Uncharacterized protein n=1 Tax=Phytophthora fragariae TaxID=53985 RepID=A0A6A3HI72_9STRA|nr:hypothetical protein PF003_g5567 [Phytophthora fragariae]KAE8918322.1 hypothetical protein PF009_g31362 [Phytophthora fragariae]KAE8968233.1 hypothetical protein PF011_g27255 [Phytophthora fragariae]KAE9062917.1 hypothetical protein PF006_g31063 [Phytophthora fragariae]KAE9164192.1 hypothetical protein PF005_g30130 [Phytophthora fragariae]